MQQWTYKWVQTGCDKQYQKILKEGDNFLSFWFLFKAVSVAEVEFKHKLMEDQAYQYLTQHVIQAYGKDGVIYDGEAEFKVCDLEQGPEYWVESMLEDGTLDTWVSERLINASNNDRLFEFYGGY